MCNCITEIEKKTFEAIQAQKEGEFKKGDLWPSNFPILKGNKFGNRVTHSEYEFTFAPKKVNGDIGKPKKQTVNLLHAYCPFCGEKYPE